VRRCPGLEEGRTVALPLEKLGTSYPPRTTPIDADRARRYAAATNEVYEAGASTTRTVEGASLYVFEATSQGAVVVKHGLAEVV
jgi:hypothetical protein